MLVEGGERERETIAVLSEDQTARVLAMTFSSVTSRARRFVPRTRNSLPRQSIFNLHTTDEHVHDTQSLLTELEKNEGCDDDDDEHFEEEDDAEVCELQRCSRRL